MREEKEEERKEAGSERERERWISEDRSKDRHREGRYKRKKLDNQSNVKSEGHINLISPINSNIIAYAVTANSSKITQGYS